ncbi:MAG TPA: nucleoside 2-deoxyribosyltransferase [Acidimicrobiales bacterium]|nr:nucleoside 2-deoxyribosyltransferase [Acidimicrobiales bacterium]
MPAPPSIYIASPLGFLAYTRAFNSELVTLVTRKGARALDPWNTNEGRMLGELCANNAGEQEIARANLVVGRANMAMIRECDGLLACLDGVSVDDGTAAEIGYAVGIGRIAGGFRLDPRSSGDNRATTVNLQIASLIESTGGTIHQTPEPALDHLLERLAAKR